MRILLIDVDSLRPDHLGCYGYLRDTSPTVDRLASEGLRFDRVYASDAPCLPSRTSLATGRLGIHHGAVGHGGSRADPYPLGSLRGFRAPDTHLNLFQVLRQRGIRATSISPFPTRHAAWWVLAGLAEWHDPGKMGDERADDINALALPWLEQHAKEDDWLLHLNYWDPHTVYRTPESYGNPFANAPAPAWLTSERLAEHRASYGPMSARDGSRAWFGWASHLPWVPEEIETLEDFKGFVDGYDTGVRYFDEHLAQVLDALTRAGVLDETIIVVTADHGESLGELNVYGDHQTADESTCRLPMIVRWPGRFEPGVDSGLHYQFDVTATLLEMLGAEVPAAWDAQSFAGAPEAVTAGRSTAIRRDGDPASRQSGQRELASGRSGVSAGRDELVLSQMAWACQRAVRWDRWLMIRTYDPGLKDLPEAMLFDIESDPHETDDLTQSRPDILREGLARLERWQAEMLRRTGQQVDPMREVLAEGGPFHTRDALPDYLRRLRETGRAAHAERLEERHASRPATPSDISDDRSQVDPESQ